MDFIAFIAAGHNIIIYVCFFLSNLNAVTERLSWWEITLVWSTANFSIRTFIQMSDFENQLLPPTMTKPEDNFRQSFYFIIYMTLLLSLSNITIHLTPILIIEFELISFFQKCCFYEMVLIYHFLKE